MNNVLLLCGAFKIMCLKILVLTKYFYIERLYIRKLDVKLNLLHVQIYLHAKDVFAHAINIACEVNVLHMQGIICLHVHAYDSKLYSMWHGLLLFVCHFLWSLTLTMLTISSAMIHPYIIYTDNHIITVQQIKGTRERLKKDKYDGGAGLWSNHVLYSPDVFNVHLSMLAI